MRRTLHFLLLALAAAGALSAVPHAATSAAAAPGLDTVLIHDLYLEGDFEKATGQLERALKEGKVRTHADSVFAYKHLGVMYAANENSREKGKYYMLQLVTIEPTARIMDMYASDMIYMIFKNIKEEYEVTKGKLDRAERHVAANQSVAAPPPAAAATSPARETGRPGAAARAPESRRTRNYLLAGGAVAVLVGAGIAAHYVLEDEPASGTDRHEIDR